MRDIEAYTKQYVLESFEPVKVKYRRKKIQHIIEKYYSQKILEVGCGLEPLFLFDNDYNRRWTIIEPSDVFLKNAEKLSNSYDNVKCIQGFFEDVISQKSLWGG